MNTGLTTSHAFPDEICQFVADYAVVCMDDSEIVGWSIPESFVGALGPHGLQPLARHPSFQWGNNPDANPLPLAQAILNHVMPSTWLIWPVIPLFADRFVSNFSPNWSISPRDVFYFLYPHVMQRLMSIPSHAEIKLSHVTLKQHNQQWWCLYDSKPIPCSKQYAAYLIAFD